jgi:hypothetical protein
MKRLRIYADTSVFGGCFDTEFAVESRRLFEEVGQGRFVLVVSPVTTRELDRAPVTVQEVLGALPASQVEYVRLSEETDALRDAYVAAGIVGPASVRDAEHIAAASVAGVDMVVSWNFRHIVHYDKIAGYHAINLLHGYPTPFIYSPKEMVTP